MSIVRRVQQGAARLRRLARPARSAATPLAPRHAGLRLAVPSPFGGDPWLRVEVGLSEREGDGGMHLRAHIDGCVRVPESGRERPSLDGASDRRGLVYRSRTLAAGAVRGGLQRMPEGMLDAVRDRRVRGWLDVRTSELPLASGAGALMPARLRELCGGDLPRSGEGLPRLGTWFSPIAGARPGFAQLTLMQIDSDDRPGGVAVRPFAVHASLATVVEEAPPAGNAE